MGKERRWERETKAGSFWPGRVKSEQKWSAQHVNKGNALQPHFMYEHATAHMPLSGYSIIFQCRADYLSMEGKWTGENPSANLKWHDSGLKEPACFSFLVLQLRFHSPLRKQSDNRRSTARHTSFTVLTYMQHFSAVKGEEQTYLPTYRVPSFLKSSVWQTQGFVI